LGGSDGGRQLRLQIGPDLGVQRVDGLLPIELDDALGLLAG
jgi:hypothetical protein